MQPVGRGTGILGRAQGRCSWSHTNHLSLPPAPFAPENQALTSGQWREQQPTLQMQTLRPNNACKAMARPGVDPKSGTRVHPATIPIPATPPLCPSVPQCPACGRWEPAGFRSHHIKQGELPT